MPPSPAFSLSPNLGPLSSTLVLSSSTALLFPVFNPLPYIRLTLIYSSSCSSRFPCFGSLSWINLVLSYLYHPPFLGPCVHLSLPIAFSAFSWSTLTYLTPSLHFALYLSNLSLPDLDLPHLPYLV